MIAKDQPTTPRTVTEHVITIKAQNLMREYVWDVWITKAFRTGKDSYYVRVTDKNQDTDEFTFCSEKELKNHLDRAGFFGWIQEEDEQRAKVIRENFWKDFIDHIFRNNTVGHVGNIAGHRKGFTTSNGVKLLITGEAKLITPAAGRYPIIEGFLRRLFGEEQYLYIRAWLKVGVEALRDQEFRKGQALIIAGEINIGKSFLINNIVKPLLGGRCADPFQVMSGGTGFNSLECSSELLLIDDEKGRYDNRDRRQFGSWIKKVAAVEEHKYHAKNKDPFTITPQWRLVFLVNDEPEDLMVLPTMNGPLQDKMMILKAYPGEMPMPTVTTAERAAFRKVVRDELPAFEHDLFNWEIPKDLLDGRMGVKTFHHPEILSKIQELSDEQKFLDFIDNLIFESPESQKQPWIGTQHQLEQQLKLSDSSKDVYKLLSWSKACGTFLGRLMPASQGRISCKHINNRNTWTIQPPGWTQETGSLGLDVNPPRGVNHAEPPFRVQQPPALYQSRSAGHAPKLLPTPLFCPRQTPALYQSRSTSSLPNC